MARSALLVRRAPTADAYAPRVIPHRQARVAASGGVLLALIGLFIGHTLEYLRVWGPPGVVGFDDQPGARLHAPGRAACSSCSAPSSRSGLARAWQALNQRLDRAAAGVRRHLAWTAGELAGEHAGPDPAPGTRLVAIWLPLAAAQIVLYLVQENVEAVARSQPAPGLGAITGIHWAAPLVHLYVSLLLACLVRICQVLFHRREVVVERVEALLRAIVRRRLRAAASIRRRAPSRRLAPIDRLGRHLWRRPPPLLLDR